MFQRTKRAVRQAQVILDSVNRIYGFRWSPRELDEALRLVWTGQSIPIEVIAPDVVSHDVMLKGFGTVRILVNYTRNQIVGVEPR